MFHALCKDTKGEYLPDNPCTKTFLDTFIKRNEKSGANSKHTGSFIFMCDFCLTNDENDKASDLKSHVKSLESEVASMKSDICTGGVNLILPHFTSSQFCLFWLPE